MIQGGMFGFPLLLIVFASLLVWQTVRELVLTAASLYLQYRIWNDHRAGAEDPAKLKKAGDQFVS